MVEVSVASFNVGAYNFSFLVSSEVHFSEYGHEDDGDKSEQGNGGEHSIDGDPERPSGSAGSLVLVDIEEEPGPDAEHEVEGEEKPVEVAEEDPGSFVRELHDEGQHEVHHPDEGAEEEDHVPEIVIFAAGGFEEKVGGSEQHEASENEVGGI